MRVGELTVRHVAPRPQPGERLLGVIQRSHIQSPVAMQGMRMATERTESVMFLDDILILILNFGADYNLRSGQHHVIEWRP